MGQFYFKMFVESLKLPPTTHVELMASLADGSAEKFEKNVPPELYRDVLGRVYHRDYPDVEIISEEERRRFDANMVLLFFLF